MTCAYRGRSWLCEAKISTIVLSSCTIMTQTFFAPLQFKPEEITAIMKDFDEPGSLAPTGLHLGGVKYMVIQGEPGAVVRGKKVYTSYSLCSVLENFQTKNLFSMM